MTSKEFAVARASLGLTALRFSVVFRIGDQRTVRRYETGENKIPGPLALLIEIAMTTKAARLKMGFTLDEHTRMREIGEVQ